MTESTLIHLPDGYRIDGAAGRSRSASDVDAIGAL
jgi:hypothetical protein